MSSDTHENDETLEPKGNEAESTSNLDPSESLPSQVARADASEVLLGDSIPHKILLENEGSAEGRELPEAEAQAAAPVVAGEAAPAGAGEAADVAEAAPELTKWQRTRRRTKKIAGGTVHGIDTAARLPGAGVRMARSVSMGKTANNASRYVGTAAGTGAVIYGGKYAASFLVDPQAVLANMYYGTTAGLAFSAALPVLGPGGIYLKRNIQSGLNGRKSKKEYDAILKDVFSKKNDRDAFEKELAIDCGKHGDQLVNTEEEKCLAKGFHLSGLMHPDQCPYLAQMVHGGDLKYARHACTRMIALAHVCNNGDTEEDFALALRRAAESLAASAPEDQKEAQTIKFQKELEEAFQKVQQGDSKFRDALKNNDLLGEEGVDDANNKSVRCKQFRETAVAYGRMVNTWQRERMEGTVTATAIGPTAVAAFTTGRWWTAVTGPLLYGYRWIYRGIKARKSTLELDANDPKRVLRGKDNSDIVPREARLQGDAITDLALIRQAQDGEITATEESIGKDGMQWYGTMKARLWAELADSARKTHYKDIGGFASACSAALGSVITGTAAPETGATDEKKDTKSDELDEQIQQKRNAIEELKTKLMMGTRVADITVPLHEKIDARKRVIRTEVIAENDMAGIQTREESVQQQLSTRRQELRAQQVPESGDLTLGGIEGRIEKLEAEKKAAQSKINRDCTKRIKEDAQIMRWEAQVDILEPEPEVVASESTATDAPKKKSAEEKREEERKRKQAARKILVAEIEKNPQVVALEAQLERLLTRKGELANGSKEQLSNGELLASRTKDPAIRRAFALVVASAWEQVKDNTDWRKDAAKSTGSGLFYAGKAIVQSPVAQKTALVSSPMIAAYALGAGPLGMVMATGATLLTGLVAVISHVKRKKKD